MANKNEYYSVKRRYTSLAFVLFFCMKI